MAVGLLLPCAAFLRLTLRLVQKLLQLAFAEPPLPDLRPFELLRPQITLDGAVAYPQGISGFADGIQLFHMDSLYQIWHRLSQCCLYTSEYCRTLSYYGMLAV